MSIGEGAIIVAMAFAAALAGLAALALMLGRWRPPSPALFAEPPDATVFLFDGDALLDATPGARAVLAHSPARGGSAMSRLLTWLAPRFPDIGATLARVGQEGRASLQSHPGGTPLVLVAEQRGGLLRLSIEGSAQAATYPAGLADLAMQDERDLMRAAVDAAPLALWVEGEDGAVTWANGAYFDLVLRTLPPGEELGWPLPRLFPDASADGTRVSLSPQAGGSPLWFDAALVPRDSGGRIGHALPADRLARSEASLRSFTQTLTKTFAELRIGLAIFDAGRRLQIFNPALLDLTGLPPDFLAARPRMTAFLDALRERELIPEPPDYRRWRRQMTALEKAAVSGIYDEVWTLSNGQSWRVTGRPHPDGAVALMFDDISEELTQTRRYRADLELGQTVIDAMDDAVAVFDPAGALVMSNAAYAALWGHDPGASVGDDGGAVAMIDHWRAGSAPTALWDGIEDALCTAGPLAPLRADFRLADGRRVAVGLRRLSQGVTMVSFRPDAAAGSGPTAEPLPAFQSIRRSA
ncbi:MAG TPA: PAS-domain containing protein [Paracoccaceae bacterium]|nr:PAS-domain containing protein [Paracoccaceae bacterium]HMO70975.1 PAS-domain containing protein [Paracoccaceae bacterium]